MDDERTKFWYEDEAQKHSSPRENETDGTVLAIWRGLEVTSQLLTFYTNLQIV